MKPNTKSLKYLVEVSMERGVMQEHQLTNTTWEQELEARTQAILQWVSETVIGPDCSEDEDGSGDSCEDCKADHGYYANVHNELRAEQREILRKEGLKDE